MIVTLVFEEATCNFEGLREALEGTAGEQQTAAQHVSHTGHYSGGFLSEMWSNRRRTLCNSAVEVKLMWMGPLYKQSGNNILWIFLHTLSAQPVASENKKKMRA